MVRILAVVAAVATALAPAVADNCKSGLYYCGYNLLAIGGYFMQIDDALREAGLPTDLEHVNKSLFYCVGGSDGAIYHDSYCRKGCFNGGTAKSDHC